MFIDERTCGSRRLKGKIVLEWHGEGVDSPNVVFSDPPKEDSDV